MRKKILLIGGGGHCKSVIDVIESLKEFEIFGIIDKEENLGKQVLGYEIIGTDEDLEKFSRVCDFALITIGFIKDISPRKRLYQRVKKLGYKLPVIISPLAHVSRYSEIGEGTVVMHHVIINSNVKIGVNCIINNKALIEHDCVIGDHCHISTGAILNGGVKVGSETFIGSGAICVENTVIKPFSFIKAGSLVK